MDGNVDKRQKELTEWLKKVLMKSNFTLTPASSDASFRRYFRIHFPETTLIAMDAPPAQEDCTPFVKVADHLLGIGLNIPQVIAQDIDLGFLVLKDLGDETYLAKLKQSNASDLYLDAINALIKMQLAKAPQDLPHYDAQLLSTEMQLFPDWYIKQHLKLTITEKQQATLDKTFALLKENILAQEKVMVHRDFHARNLMVTRLDNPGILDFQDAVHGPATYDLVSLLKDAYIEWEEQYVIDWAVRYWQSARAAGLELPDDFSTFYRDFEWMGVQRHIKILGIFARLSHRDGKDAYLKDMPLVMHYLRKTCERYVELRPMFALLNQLEEIKPQTGYTF